MATTNKAFRVKSGLVVEGAELAPAKGTTTYPPILLTSSAGALLATATAGAFEFDGTNFYLTPASTRKTIAFISDLPALGYIGGYQSTSTAQTSIALTGINSLTSTGSLTLITPAGANTSTASLSTGNGTSTSGSLFVGTGDSSSSAMGSWSTGSLSIKTGSGTGTGLVSTGSIIIATGDATGAGGPAGDITIDGGAGSSGGLSGTVYIGPLTAQAVELGRIGKTTIIRGNLQIDGTTTTVNSSTITIDDKNLELGAVSSGVVSTTGTIGTVAGAGPFTATITNLSKTTGLIVGSTITATAGTGNFGSGVVTVSSIVSDTSITISSTLTFTAGTVTNITGSAASDGSANGGGITLKGSTDKTWQWVSSFSSWTSNQDINITSTGTAYRIAGNSVLSGTTLGSFVTLSSLTKVAPLSSGTAGYVKVDSSGNLSSVNESYAPVASPALTGTPTINSVAGIVTASGNTSNTTPLTLSALYSSSTYTGGEFIVKATNTTNIEITKILVITDGTHVYVTNYGGVYSVAPLFTVDFTYTSGNVNMVVTPVTGTTANIYVRVVGTLLAVS